MKLVLPLIALALLCVAGCGKPACSCKPCNSEKCCAACKGNGVMCNCATVAGAKCKCCEHCPGAK